MGCFVVLYLPVYCHALVTGELHSFKEKFLFYFGIYEFRGDRISFSTVGGGRSLQVGSGSNDKNQQITVNTVHSQSRSSFLTALVRRL